MHSMVCHKLCSGSLSRQTQIVFLGFVVWPKPGASSRERVEMHGASKELQEFVDRCTFKTAKTKQYWLAFADQQWKVTPEIIDPAEQDCQSLSSSLSCEEQIHYMKNCKRAKASVKTRRPARCMGAVVAQEVMTKRFGFQGFPVDADVPCKCRNLSATAWVPSPTDDSVSLEGAAATQQSASYYSPTAADIGRVAADLCILDKLGQDIMLMHDMHNLNMGCFCEVEHMIVFGEVPSKQWYLALFHYKKSASVCWPVELHQFSPTMQKLFVELDQTPSKKQTQAVGFGEATCFPTLRNWDRFLAHRIEFHSWAWQVHMYPACQSKFHPGVRLFATYVEKPLSKVAAENAWWDLAAPELQLTAKAHKLPVTKAASLFDMLFEMTTVALKMKDDQKVLDIMKNVWRGFSHPRSLWMSSWR